MRCAGPHPFSYVGCADNCPAVVEYSDQVVLFDAPCYSIFGVDSYNPVGVFVDQYSMFFDVVDPAMFAVAHGVEAISWVGSYQLERVFSVKFGCVMAFPRRDILGHHGSFRIIWVKSF